MLMNENEFGVACAANSSLVKINRSFQIVGSDEIHVAHPKS
ncbi:hypothetical protein IWQ51_002094 [Labrenzia sp. EL_142]|nr:hypothetical protein [Labrenzia sp. EL_142]